MATTLPSVTEMVDRVGGGADPVRCHDVRKYVYQQLAAQLRPTLERLVKENDAAPGEPFVFNSAASAKRDIKNHSLALLAFLEEEAVIEDLLNRWGDVGVTVR
jgi:hypothetical protein